MRKDWIVENVDYVFLTIYHIFGTSTSMRHEYEASKIYFGKGLALARRGYRTRRQGVKE